MELLPADGPEFDAMFHGALAGMTKDAPGGWQPIETAPKDGTPILGTNANYAYTLGRCAVYYWDDDEAEGGKPGWYLPSDDPTDVPHTWLTHWMPLPEPPAP